MKRIFAAVIAGLLICNLDLCAQEKAGDAKKAAPEVLLFPVKQGGKWGYINEKGTIVIKPQYDCAWDFTEGLARVQVGLKRGFIDPAGKMVLEPKYTMASAFNEGVAAVLVDTSTFGTTWNGGRWGLINAAGEWVMKPGPAEMSGLHGGVLRVKTAGLQYYRKEGPVSTWVNQGSQDFSEGLAGVKSGKWGYIDYSMSYCIAPQFDEVMPFSEGVAAVCSNKQWGYIAKPEGAAAIDKMPGAWGQSPKLLGTSAMPPLKFVIEPKFEKAGPFSAGLASVKTGGKWGFIDKAGKTVLEPAYDFAGKFSEGLCRVVKAGKHGYIDTKGKIVVEPKFDASWDFSKGLARIVVDGKEGYIDRTGKYVWEPKESPYMPRAQVQQ